MKTAHRVMGSVAVVMVLAVATMLLGPLISSPEQVRDVVQGAGYAGWAVYVLLVTAAGPLPIPSPVVVTGGGYVYGTLLGGLLGYIGLILGGVISFYMIRWGGRSLLERLVDHHHRIHFYHLFNQRGHIFVLLVFAVPIFPADMICLLLGLTHMRLRTLVGLLMAGSLPRAILIAALGSEMAQGLSWKVVILVIIMGAGGLIVIFREKIKKFLFHELHEVEHLVQQAEKFEGEL